MGVEGKLNEYANTSRVGTDVCLVAILSRTAYKLAGRWKLRESTYRINDLSPNRYQAIVSVL